MRQLTFSCSSRFFFFWARYFPLRALYFASDIDSSVDDLLASALGFGLFLDDICVWGVR